MYFVILELRNNRSYDVLIGTLLNDLHSVRILENVYCFEMPNADARQARDFLRGFIDSDDGLIVVESKTWAVHKVEASPHKWDGEEFRTEKYPYFCAFRSFQTMERVNGAPKPPRFEQN